MVGRDDRRNAVMDLYYKQMQEGARNAQSDKAKMAARELAQKQNYGNTMAQGAMLGGLIGGGPVGAGIGAVAGGLLGVGKASDWNANKLGGVLSNPNNLIPDASTAIPAGMVLAQNRRADQWASLGGGGGSGNSVPSATSSNPKVEDTYETWAGSPSGYQLDSGLDSNGNFRRRY